MARRGMMTALQAALAGIGGAASGYVQQEERKRKQLIEDEERQRIKALQEAGIRAEQRDILRAGGTQIAGLGEQVAGPMPSAIPLSGVGNAIAAAEQAGGPATSRGAMRQTVGGQTFMLPGAAETRAAALANALEQAQAERDITQRFRAEDTEKAERKAFNFLKKEGKVRGEFDPEYGRYVADEEDLRATRRSLATQRPGTSRAEMIEERVLMNIGQMAREGKPGIGNLPPTPYTPKELAKAAADMRAGMLAAFQNTPVTTDTTAATTAGSRTPQPGADFLPPDASLESFGKLTGAVTPTPPVSAPPRPTPGPAPAPTPAPIIPSTLSAEDRKAVTTLFQRRAALLSAAQTATGSSRGRINTSGALRTIDKKLQRYGITPP